jgi:hypothetical protein
MRYRIGGPGWPVADALIPAGAVIDSTTMLWAKNLNPPLNATPLDNDTWAFMQQIYADVAYLLGPRPY